MKTVLNATVFFCLLTLPLGLRAANVEIDVATVAASGSGYTLANNCLTLTDPTNVYTLSGSSSSLYVEVQAHTSTYEVVFKGLTLTPSSNAPFSVKSGAICNLTLVDSNTLTSAASSCSGLLVPAGATLEIMKASTGDLNTTGAFAGAGIGSSGRDPCGTIIIAGGTVKAVGGMGSAGIGSNGTVNITGGKVEAYGGSYATGIGGGMGGEGGTITITGGTVKAEGDGANNDIGGGPGGADGTIVITGGVVIASRYSPVPKNAAGDSLYCVTLKELSPNSSVTAMTVTGLAYDYGVTDLVTDAEGKLAIWLPLTAEDETYTVTTKVANQTKVSAVTVTTSGVTVTDQPVVEPTVVPEELVIKTFSQTASSVIFRVETGLSAEDQATLVTQKTGIVVVCGTTVTDIAETVAIDTWEVNTDNTISLTAEKGTGAKAFYQLRSE